MKSRFYLMPTLQQEAVVRTGPPSFIDLREFAKDHSQGIRLAATSAPALDRFLTNRRLLDLPQGPVTVGVISLAGGEGEVTSPADEFVIVCEGTWAVTQQERTFVLGPGRSVVLPQGARFSWISKGPVTLVFMRHPTSQPSQQRVLAIVEAPPLAPSDAPSAELLVGPTPECRKHTEYRSADGEFTCGTWDSTPYHRRAMSYRHHELMVLLEGSVTFEDESGRRRTFSRGDLLFVPQHAKCSWESRQHVKKVFAIYRPA
jgi:uncharacterized cupin superfamily protein